MRLMNFSNSPKKAEPNEGREIAGMISIYLVRLLDGTYLVGNSGDKATATPDWSKAKFMFGAVGMFEARSLAEKYGGAIYIVNCTPPVEYKRHN